MHAPESTITRQFYLRQRGDAMPGVCLFVCYSLCPSLSNFTYKLLSGCSRKFYGRCNFGQGSRSKFWTSFGSEVQIRIRTPDTDSLAEVCALRVLSFIFRFSAVSFPPVAILAVTHSLMARVVFVIPAFQKIVDFRHTSDCD